LTDLVADGVLILKCVLKKWNGRTLTGFYCLRISKVGLFWTLNKIPDFMK
jgi:hypothetical protein